MCGIAGIVRLAPQDNGDAPIDEPTLRTMADQLVHRGPDDSGCYVDPHRRAGIGFRRLSIIDLAGGHQPLSNEDGDIWVGFNGEIYNYRELRTTLEGQGHTFRSACDAEVIVHAYEQYGDECIAKFEGMFAISIWDERKGRLLLARDRFGKKPLHYAIIAGRFYFASELKAILALPNVPRELDAQSLHRYLMFQYVAAPHGIYHGFHKLMPAQRLAVEADKPFAAAAAERFWTLPAQGRFEGTYDQAKQRLGELLHAAVEKRLIADVPLGAFLSGGIDSSIVVALMTELGAAPVRTFSIGFDDKRYDESRYARIVAERFQTEHHAHVVTPQAREILDTLAFHYDEPFADSSAIPTYYLSRWTRESVTVALTGDAGDECFAGYDRYRAAAVAARLNFLPRPLRRVLSAAGACLPHGRPATFSNRAYRFLRALPHPAARRYMDWITVFPPDMLAAGYSREFAERLDLDEPLAWFEALHEAGCSGPAGRANYADFHSYLPYDLLTKVDIASMACSLECRSPFLDHELAEFAVSLPIEWRLGALGGKHILKDWAASLLPQEILNRPKKGFGVPIGEWFRGELRDLLEDKLFAADSLCAAVFEQRWLRRLLDAHLACRANHEHRLWALLMLELWRERWQPSLTAR